MSWFNKEKHDSIDNKQSLRELTRQVRDLTESLRTSSYDPTFANRWRGVKQRPTCPLSIALSVDDILDIQTNFEYMLYQLFCELLTDKYSKVFIHDNRDSSLKQFNKILKDENLKPLFDALIEDRMQDAAKQVSDANVKSSELEVKCKDLTSENKRLKDEIQKLKGYSDGLKLALRDAKAN